METGSSEPPDRPNLHVASTPTGATPRIRRFQHCRQQENVEAGPKLPVLLDETLGNSDELRAGAIVVAAIVDREREHGEAVLERIRAELPEPGDESLGPLLDRLESWLIAQGFIATSEPLSREEIRSRVLASVSADIGRDHLSLGDLDAVLNQLPA